MNNYNSEHFIQKKKINKIITHNLIRLWMSVCRHRSTVIVFSRSAGRPERPGSRPSWHLQYKSSIDIISPVELFVHRSNYKIHSEKQTMQTNGLLNSFKFFYLLYFIEYLLYLVQCCQHLMFFISRGDTGHYMPTVEFIMSLKRGFFHWKSFAIRVNFKFCRLNVFIPCVMVTYHFFPRIRLCMCSGTFSALVTSHVDFFFFIWTTVFITGENSFFFLAPSHRGFYVALSIIFY